MGEKGISSAKGPVCVRAAQAGFTELILCVFDWKKGAWVFQPTSFFCWRVRKPALRYFKLQVEANKVLASRSQRASGQIRGAAQTQNIG
jgi:hypothetical protein